MWEKFGLMTNPFEIKAVERYGIIPVSTFEGRIQERLTLKKTIQTRNRSLSLVVSERGVGKTSLGNVTRSDLSERYFTPFYEVDCQHDWSSKDFILQLLAILYSTTIDVNTYGDIPKNYNELCSEIRQELRPLFEKSRSDLGISAFGFGGSYGKGDVISRAPIALLRSRFRAVIKKALKKGYAGLVFQFNNLDNFENTQISKVFADLRDFLLTDYCHFIFLGDRTMEECFKSNRKVEECISLDIHLKTMSLPIIKKILNKRYEVFKFLNRTVMPPVTDDAIETLHNLYEGNIRQIFYSLDKAVVSAGEKRLNSARIKEILYGIAAERIKTELPKRAFHVLYFILNSNGEVTNTEITEKLKLQSQNISKYLKQLKENDLIISVGKVGRNIYYKAVNEAKWLLLFPEKYVQIPIDEWFSK